MIDIADIKRIQNHILGSEKFTTPFQKIAADINNDGKISALDIITLRRAIRGELHRFSRTKAWRFVRTDYNFSPDENPTKKYYPDWEYYPIFPEDARMRRDYYFTAVRVGDLSN